MKDLFRHKLSKQPLQRLALVLIVAVFTVTAVPITVWAAPEPPSTKTDLESFVNNSAWYDPTAGLCDPNSSTSLIGKDNVQKSFNYFVSKGLTPAQSAGIVGNLRQESGSGIDPSSDNPAAVGGGGGIAQWEGGRWSGSNGLLAFAEKHGKPWDDLGLQLDFIWYEMPDQYAYGHLGELQAILPGANSDTSSLEAVKMSTTYQVATQAWELTFERAGDPRMDNRIEYAREVMEALGGTVGGGEDTETGCGGNALVGDYSFPLAPRTKRDYGYTLPCKNPVMNSPYPPIYTRNGVYTDIHGKSTNIRACHHDATPGFDLSYSGVGNKPIYAITGGEVAWVRNYGTCNSITFKANTATDKTYYWYGHIVATTEPGPKNAGDVLGYVAPQSYGSSCFASGPHLHIDRGCIIGGTRGDLATGDPQTPGSDGCRDPGFLDDLVKIWEALPEE